MSNLFVKRIESNVKHSVSVDLGQHTLLLGRNSSGKSAVVQSVELALSGIASDLAGRPLVKEASALLRLSANRGSSLNAKAILSDGSEALFTVGSDKGSKRPRNITPPTVDPFRVFPLREVRAALLGDGDTARKFFLSVAAGEVTREEILRRMPEPLKLAAQQLLAQHAASDAVGALLAGQVDAKRNAKRARDAAKAHQEVAEQVAGQLPPKPTDAEIGQARQAVEAAQRDLANAGSGGYQEIERVKQTLESIICKADEVVVYLGQLPQNPVGPLEAVKQVLAYQISQVPSYCLCCGQSVTDYSLWQSRMMQAEQLQRQTAEATAARSRAEQMHAQLRTAYDANRTLLQMLEAKMMYGGSGLTLEAAQANLRQAEEHHVQLRSLAARHENADAARGLAVAADQQVSQWSLLDKEFKKIAHDLLDASVSSFCSKVQKYLDSAEVFGINLDESGFEFGLLRDGVLHSALAGAEWARVTAAIAAAVAEPTADKLTVLIPEQDRALDPWTLTGVLQTLVHYPGQVILTSPVPPSAVPDGWTVVYTNSEGGGTPEHTDKLRQRARTIVDIAKKRESANTSGRP